MKNTRILGISGSLRADSTNMVILKTLGSLFPAGSEFNIFEGLGEIPHFCPGDEDSAAVLRFKNEIQNADAVVICTPEYAFGVPGTLKNALDWTVATGDLNNKPIAAISASPLNSGGANALTSLKLTLTALGTRYMDGSILSVANVKSKIVNGHVVQSDLLEELQKLANQLHSIILSQH